MDYTANTNYGQLESSRKQIELNRKHDNLCFALTAYVLLGAGSMLYSGNTDNINANNNSKTTNNTRNNIEAVLVDNTWTPRKDYFKLSRFRRN